MAISASLAVGSSLVVWICTSLKAVSSPGRPVVSPLHRSCQEVVATTPTTDRSRRLAQEAACGNGNPAVPVSDRGAVRLGRTPRTSTEQRTDESEQLPPSTHERDLTGQPVGRAPASNR